MHENNDFRFFSPPAKLILQNYGSTLQILHRGVV